MEFLGIGPMELIAILLILFVVFGPGDMVKMGATLGRALRRLRQSDSWRAVQQATRELRTLPDNLARQAGIDDFKEVSREFRRGVEGARQEVEDLDRQFIAWTRGAPPPDEEPETEDDEAES